MTTSYIVSTYGEGDPSDNAQRFVTWAGSATGISLVHLKYAAFGCGNSNYRFYSKVVDDVVASLSKFRASDILPTGRGNEATRTTKEDFVEWKQKLFDTLVSDFGYAKHETKYEPSIEISSAEGTAKGLLHLGTPLCKPKSKKAAALDTAVARVPVRAKRELVRYDDPIGSVIDLEVDFSALPEMKYKTGDHIAIWPFNPPDEINSLIQLLGLENMSTDPIRVFSRSAEEELKIPSPTTVQTLFQYYLDICAAVPREAVLLLVQFASTEKAKAELRSIGKNRDTYASFLEQHHLTLARLLKHTMIMDSCATWTGLPLSIVIDILPAMQPRLYSISSSRITSSRHASLTVSVKPSQLVARPDVTIPELSSTYLSQLQPETGLKMFGVKLLCFDQSSSNLESLAARWMKLVPVCRWVSSEP